MNFVLTVFALAMSSLFSGGCLAADETMEAMMQHAGMQHEHMSMVMDNRTSLNLSSAMKQQQLANMRSHLEAVQTIVELLSKQEFDKASQVAHAKLGLTDEMKKMCGMFGNAAFEQLGLAFHNSGDELGDALSTRNMSKSLQALNNTTSYCVQCHATYRQ